MDADDDTVTKEHTLKLHDFSFGGETVTLYVYYTVETSGSAESIELDKIELFQNEIYACELPEAVLLNLLERIGLWHDALQHWHSA